MDEKPATVIAAGRGARSRGPVPWSARARMHSILFLVAMLALIGMMLSGAMLIAWRDFGRPRHALTWALGFGCAALQWALNTIIVYFRLPGGPPGQPLGFLYVAMVALILLGVRQRSGYRRRRIWLAAGYAAAVLSVPALTYVVPHRGLATLLPKLFTTIALTIAALSVVPRGRPATSAERGMMLVLGAYAVTEMTLGLIGVAGGARPDRELVFVYRRMSELMTPAAFTGTGLFAVFLIVADLSTRMTRLASTDPLTGLLNRRGLDEAVAQMAPSRAGDAPSGSVILADLDGFKQLNDRFGHVAGDRVLGLFARVMRDRARRGERIARIGGEEFALVLPGIPPDEAAGRAEELRALTADVRLPDEPDLAITASFGVAPLGGSGGGDMVTLVHAALGRADAALMRAKGEGRDRVLLDAPEYRDGAVRG